MDRRAVVIDGVVPNELVVGGDFANTFENAIALQSNYAYRIIQAKWIDSSQQEFKAVLNIHGMDSLGLTNELTKVISNNMHVNIQSISLSGEAGIFNGQVTVVVQNNTILKKLIDNIKKIDGIDKVTRVYKS